MKKIIYVFQTAAITSEVRGATWKQAFMQMDGESWKQPLDRVYSGFVEIKCVPHHSLLIQVDWQTLASRRLLKVIFFCSLPILELVVANLYNLAVISVCRLYVFVLV